MSDLGLSEIASSVSSVTSTVNKGTRAINAANRMANAAGTLVGSGGSSGNKSSGNPPQMYAAPGQAAQPMAPVGTYIYIPPEVSSTGQPRFLGRSTYDAVTNMMNGNSDCLSVMVVDETNNPSKLVYDMLPDGKFALKGSTTPLEFQFDENGNTKAIALSEREYQAVLKGMQNQAVNQIMCSDKSNAALEDVDTSSWWSRNWAWLVSLVVAVAGGVAAYFVSKNYKDKAKTSKAQSSALSSKVTDLQNQVSELTAANNTSSQESSGNSTLADNSIKVVGISDTVINTGSREY